MLEVEGAGIVEEVDLSDDVAEAQDEAAADEGRDDGGKISPRMPIARWSGFWLAPAASLAASLETPSMPETAVNSW